METGVFRNCGYPWESTPIPWLKIVVCSPERLDTEVPEACFGCGVYIVGFDKAQALSMKPVRSPDYIPAKTG
jgi:hypothetical protein